MPKIKTALKFIAAVMLAHGMGKCTLAVAQVSEIKGDVIISHDAAKKFFKNPEFERDDSGVTDASSIASRSTTTPVSGKASLLIDASSSGQKVVIDSIPFGDLAPAGSNCIATFWYRGDASLYKAYVSDNGTRTSLEHQLSDATMAGVTPSAKRKAEIPFICNDGTNEHAIEIEATSASAAAIRVDNLHLGENRNVVAVSQAHQLGAIYYAATSNCSWSRTGVGSDSYGSFSADSDCPAAGASGYASAPGTKIPAITFASIPPGRLVCAATGAFVRSGTASSAARYRFSDGTSASATQSVFGDATGITGVASPAILGEFSYTSPQANVTINVQGLTTNTSNAVTIDATATDFFISCQHFPEGSQVVTTSIDSTITPSRAFTPTGSWTTNTTYSGVWWRTGDKYFSRFRVATTGAPDATSLTVNYLLSGLSIDTTKLVSTATNGSVPIGVCKVFDSGTFYMFASLYYNGSNGAVVGFASSSASNHPDQNFNNTFPMTWANGDAVECVTDGIPIQGWDAPSVMVPIYKGGVVSRDNTAGPTTVSTSTTVSSSSTLTDQYDTVLGNPSGGSFTSTLLPAASMKGRIYNLIRANYTGTNTWTIDPNSTELICGQSTFVVARTLSIVSDGTNWHGIGPECSLPIIVEATSTNTTSYNNGPNTFTVGTEIVDTHNAWASNTFTAPRAGYYRFCATGVFTGIIAASNQYIRLFARDITDTSSVLLDGVTSGDVATINSQTWTVSGCRQLALGLGHTADFQVVTNTAANQTQVGTSGLNNISVTYLGPSAGVQ